MRKPAPVLRAALPLVGALAGAEKQRPKGPKAGECDDGDVLVCHLAQQGHKP